MQIKYLGKQFSIDLESLEEKTVGKLKEKIKEAIPQCSDIPLEKILLFFNKKKITSSPETSLEDNSVQIDDSSVIFVVIISGDSQKKQTENKKESTREQEESHKSGTMNSPGAMGHPGQMDPSTILDSMLSDPAAMDRMIELTMPTATAEQKAMLRESAEAMRKNPELMKSAMNAMQQGFSPYGAGMPSGSPYNPAMPYNPSMTSPMMGNNNGNMSPYGNNNGNVSPYGMPNPYNPYMFNPQMVPPAPKEGPCCHGFYPLKNVNGNLVQQTSDEVYEDKLTVLVDMGFTDRKANLKALETAKGDISEAIDILTNAGKK